MKGLKRGRDEDLEEIMEEEDVIVSSGDEVEDMHSPETKRLRNDG